jgi:4-amino-4-deoxy-L-arabinose transferase-like glycosyltransferase
MTVFYRPTQNSQEPEPQRPGAQQPPDQLARQQGEPVANPPGRLAGNVQPASHDEAKRNDAHSHTSSPVASNSGAGTSHRPAPFIHSTMQAQGREVKPVGAGGANGANEQRDNAGVAPGRRATLRRDVTLRTTNKHGAPPPEIENGNVILYRRPNFFLRTAYRPGQKQNPLRKPTGHTAVMPTVMPHQETRIAGSETRLMPNVTLNTAKQTRAIPVPAWLEAIMVVLSLAGTFVAHAYNMFNFPRYELDEGTYISNAWAVTQGLISPYPYGYGHPPLAWMQIAVWIQLSGGLFTFGNALNSGRVFMLLYAVGSALLVYLIVRRWSGSRSAALLALVIFSLSPLSITYQRQIFLDNVATFWLLLSLYWLAVSNSRLLYIVLAAIAFGISVLSKEVYLICLPCMIYAAWLHTTKFQRKFTLVAFIYIVIAVCSGFVLMAVLKDEFFPYSWHLPWDTHPHLSMLDTFVGQAQRGQTGGSFIYSWVTWLDNDTFFIVCSIAAPLFNLVYGLWNRKYLLLSLPPFKSLKRKSRKTAPVPDRHLLLSLLAISFWILLIRGGQVLSFYIIPLIPLVALNVAMALNTILGWLGKLVHFDVVRAVLLIIVIAAIIPYDIKATGFRFYQHPTSAQQQALVWVRTHVQHNAFIVINSYLYLDLRVPAGQGIGDAAPYPHAEVYWNVAYDPELHQQALQSNWDRIDYIVADSEMLRDIQTYGGEMEIINTALQHSILRAEFRADDHNLQIVVQAWQVIHQNPSPNVYSGPGSANGVIAQYDTTAFSNGPPGGDKTALANRRWAIMS